MPNKEVKEQLYSQIFDPNNSESTLKKKIILWNLYKRTQSDLRAQLSQNYIKDVNTHVSDLDIMLAGRLGSLAPDACLKNSRNELSQLLRNNKNLPPWLRKNLVESIQKGEICETVRSDLSEKISQTSSQ
ncbi:MAG: hypothetical protein R2827_04645 [Bdellovibrionales bacterium]